MELTRFAKSLTSHFLCSLESQTHINILATKSETSQRKTKVGHFSATKLPVSHCANYDFTQPLADCFIVYLYLLPLFLSF